ncbi:CapA family protein [Pelosinus sp. UFO1]|uniref:CapA family protein n=1 Tax=Pelosinus sp. UFO1 TaxID=484770 RepID=UPI0004D1C415|nr:CapA family protein [Pelosinus sp. UFO1]AIF49847.1 Capsule synthesis protein, CapA [Pelosinus sp. UFO1]
MSKISIVATGDSFITQRLPQDVHFIKLKSYIEAHDVRFTNFEILLHDFEVYPAPTSGGTWAVARPEVLQDIKQLGFNMMAWANNHTSDWNIDGILTTMKHLDENKCIHAGVGRNLAEASQPRYLDTPQGRVALIGITSTISEWGMASAQRPDVLGRPGANVLRYQAIHKVRPEEFEKLREIVEQTEVNSNRILDEKEGFKKPVIGGYYVGNIRFEPGDEPGTITKMNPKDAERIIRSIREAARQADVVLVSHHTHERKGLEKDRPADFARDFAKLCIDSGAHAYIGHGPHIWRGIEIYKNRPIFYSLGDFVFQNDSVERQPTEFYDLYDLGVENTVSDGLDARSANETRGLVVDQKVYESAMVSFAVTDGEIDEITLSPLSLGFEYGRARRGRPQFSDEENGERILRDIGDLSKEFGTKITIKDGIGTIELK